MTDVLIYEAVPFSSTWLRFCVLESGPIPKMILDHLVILAQHFDWLLKNASCKAERQSTNGIFLKGYTILPIQNNPNSSYLEIQNWVYQNKDILMIAEVLPIVPFLNARRMFSRIAHSQTDWWSGLKWRNWCIALNWWKRSIGWHV